MIEFTPWPKIARLFREMVITEKIDGTNAAVGIREFPFGWHVGGVDDQGEDHDQPQNACLVLGPASAEDGLPGKEYLVYAQSRSRLITPGQDNHGFARWVCDNAAFLAGYLGPGIHFGEWWGSGINRGYGLENGEKRFSLFNVKRWNREDFQIDGQCGYIPPGLDVVPILYRGPFNTGFVNETLAELRLNGSAAAPGFMRPEGIVIYHSAARVMLKATLEDDQVPKVATRGNFSVAA